MDKGGEQEGEGDMNGESSMDACTPTFVNRQPVGICCMTQGTQIGALFTYGSVLHAILSISPSLKSQLFKNCCF